MNRTAIATTLILVTGSAAADPVYHPAGPNLSFGDISNSQSIMFETTNPAAGASVLLTEDGRFRIGLLSSVGVGYEFGDVSSLEQQVNDTTDLLVSSQVESLQTIIDANPVPANYGIDPVVTDNYNTLVATEAANIINSNIISQMNLLTRDLEQNGYFKGWLSLHYPLTPLVVTNRFLGGSLTFDVNSSAAGFFRFYNDDVTPLTATDIINNTNLQQVITDYNNGTTTTADLVYDLITSDTTALIKGAVTSEMSLGYSWQLSDFAFGNLFIGLRAKYYQLQLTQYAQRLADMPAGQQVMDVYDQQSDRNYTDVSDLGLDLGLLWVADHYRLGATLNNINTPSFQYPILDLTDGAGNVNYDTSGRVYATLREGSVYEMKPQLRMEAAFFSQSTNWVMGAAFDANEVEDPFGQAYQWATASVAYASGSFYIPGLRVGYRTNLAGTGQSFAGLGLTWLGVNLDYARGLEQVTVSDGTNSSTQPRTQIINLGFGLTF